MHFQRMVSSAGEYVNSVSCDHNAREFKDRHRQDGGGRKPGGAGSRMCEVYFRLSTLQTRVTECCRPS